LVPVFGALVCAVLFGNRLNAALTSSDAALWTAPLVALGILIAGALIGFSRSAASARSLS
ncbi:MAG TPA: hypothetical protein VHM91_01890, partial [Verrucomicrobiales bacterium]|nr:hypothetical protein [Verrucomicrobiales bacterium]